MQRTGWYPWSIRPHRVGWYETKGFNIDTGMPLFWNGAQWGFWQDESWIHWADDSRDSWRGLARPA